MTSFAFIFGCLPLWFASGSGAVARRVLGSTVIGEMIATSAIAIFLIPVSFMSLSDSSPAENPLANCTDAPPDAGAADMNTPKSFELCPIGHSCLQISENRR
jgi:AcrB/AcrD/AcrF family